jgi:hypothetical protein
VLTQAWCENRRIRLAPRLYQELDAERVVIKLDLYDSMIHNFQDRIPDARESVLARRKMRTSSMSI